MVWMVSVLFLLGGWGNAGGTIVPRDRVCDPAWKPCIAQDEDQARRETSSSPGAAVWACWETNAEKSLRSWLTLWTEMCSPRP